jgi:hypothetical protein
MSALSARFCQIVPAPVVRSKRLLCGSLGGTHGTSLHDEPLLTYCFEIDQPWFPGGSLLETIREAIVVEFERLVVGPTIEDQFERFLRGLNQSLHRIAEAGEADWIGGLNAGLFLFADDQLYFAHTGHIPAYLVQRGTIRQITDDSQPSDNHPLKTFGNLASGTLAPGDTILFGNTELYRELSLDGLRRVVSSHTPAGACAAIIRELRRSKNAAVCTSIISVQPSGVATHQEITVFQLALELESAARRVARTAKPHLDRVVHGTKKIAHAVSNTAIAAGRGAQSTSQRFSEVAMPAISKAVTPLKERMPNLPEAPALPTFKPQLPEGIERISARRGRLLRKRFAFLENETFFHHWWRDRRIRLLMLSTAIVILIGVPVTRALVRTSPGTPKAATATKNPQLAQAEETVAFLNETPSVALFKKAQIELTTFQPANDTEAEQLKTIWTTYNTLLDPQLNATRYATQSALYPLGSSRSSVVVQGPVAIAAGGTETNAVASRLGATAPTGIALPAGTTKIISLTRTPKAATSSITSGLTADNKIIEFTGGEAPTTRLATSEEGSFATATSLQNFGNNLYLVDARAGMIWRYPATGESKYGKATSLINPKRIDLKNMISVAIDGAIYVLKADGSVVKIVGNAVDTSFDLKGMPALLETKARPLQIFTNDQTQSLYILDAGVRGTTFGTAILHEYGKDGTFRRAFTFPMELNDITGMDMNTTTQQLWLLQGENVYEFKLP